MSRSTIHFNEKGFGFQEGFPNILRGTENPYDFSISSQIYYTKTLVVLRSDQFL